MDVSADIDQDIEELLERSLCPVNLLCCATTLNLHLASSYITLIFKTGYRDISRSVVCVFVMNATHLTAFRGNPADEDLE